MLISIRLSIAAALGFGTLWSDAVMPQERSILVRSHRAHLLPLDQVTLVGRDMTGIPFRIVARRENSLEPLSLEAHRNGRRLGLVRLAPGRFSQLDLYTLTIETGGRGELVVSLNYGDERPDCFYNSDGRDQVSIYFSTTDQPRIYPISLANCDHNSGD